MAGTRTGGRRAAQMSDAEAERLATALDGLMYYFRKWYTQQWNSNPDSPGSILRRHLLERLARTGEPMRMGDLAAAVDTSGRMVTAIVDALESEGVVRRTPDPADRRAWLIELLVTPEAARAHLHEYHRDAATLFDGVSAADRESFIRVARHVVSASRARLGDTVVD